MTDLLESHEADRSILRTNPPEVCESDNSKELVAAARDVPPVKIAGVAELLRQVDRHKRAALPKRKTWREKLRRPIAWTYASLLLFTVATLVWQQLVRPSPIVGILGFSAYTIFVAIWTVRLWLPTVRGLRDPWGHFFSQAEEEINHDAALLQDLHDFDDDVLEFVRVALTGKAEEAESRSRFVFGPVEAVGLFAAGWGVWGAVQGLVRNEGSWFVVALAGAAVLLALGQIGHVRDKFVRYAAILEGEISRRARHRTLKRQET